MEAFLTFTIKSGKNMPRDSGTWKKNIGWVNPHFTIKAKQ